MHSHYILQVWRTCNLSQTPLYEHLLNTDTLLWTASSDGHPLNTDTLLWTASSDEHPLNTDTLHFL